MREARRPGSGHGLQRRLGNGEIALWVVLKNRTGRAYAGVRLGQGLN